MKGPGPQFPAPVLSEESKQPGGPGEFFGGSWNKNPSPNPKGNFFAISKKENDDLLMVFSPTLARPFLLRKLFGDLTGSHSRQV